MINHVFHGLFTLTGASEVVSQEWRITGTFNDRVGKHKATDIEVNDLLFIDTGIIEPFSITTYRIKTIHDADWRNNADLTIRYLLTNENMFPNPPLTWCVGSQGVITRASPTTGLIPVYSTQEQNFPDIFSARLHNYNTQNRIDSEFDELIDYGLTTQRLALEHPGVAVLPVQPYGQLVNGLALLHLNNGVVVELTGAQIEYTGVHWQVRLEEEDYNAFQTEASEVTVSYLCNLSR
jgi:hypothetical protein